MSLFNSSANAERVSGRCKRKASELSTHVADQDAQFLIRSSVILIIGYQRLYFRPRMPI